ncbi:hypothetical protein [Symmachiella dynata]|uniref:hypothetical protein n=1 Tax=Symmachiella dynata TaxID=2527995 RepID=UPI0011A80AEA|nr:hypothetical protein [Symmachiella dynata]
MMWRIEQTRQDTAKRLVGFVRRNMTSRSLTILFAGLALWATGSTAWAQSSGRYYPLNQNTPPGVAGRWAGLIGKADGHYFQPVRVELPGDGQVTFYGAGGEANESPAPGQIGMLVGHVYRFRISHMPQHPGAELYPSIELLDRLHPPRGRAADFPIPITFSDKEIELALNGRMVTKVIYLEQPQLANPIKFDAKVPVEVLAPQQNALAAADYYGRPMAIVRLGGRVPLMQGNNNDFFGDQAPIAVSATAQPPGQAVAPSGRMITK